jgi:hypothetical protein
MNTQRIAKPRLNGVVMILIVTTLLPRVLLGQGSLIPPGSPEPTMKTLAQIEPRTPIDWVPYIIMAPGSYYLATNLTVNANPAITIAVNNVTLDLNGFTIASTAAKASAGILLSGTAADPRSGIRIFNGHIRGTTTNSGMTYSGGGFTFGIAYGGNPPVNCRVSDVTVAGCSSHGIYLRGDPTAVENCSVRSVGGYGIVATTVSHCNVYQSGDVSIIAYLATDCYGFATSGSDAVRASNANNCYGVATNSGNGIGAESALNCHGFHLGGPGMGLSASNAFNCYAYHNPPGPGYAMEASNAQNCRAYNAGSGMGLFALTAINCQAYSNESAGMYASVALNCTGKSGANIGISAKTAQNCEGYSTGNSAVFAVNAVNCYGESSAGTGVAGTLVQGCYGTSTSGTGLSAAVAFNNFGESRTGTGLHFDRIGANCWGQRTHPAFAASNYVLGMGMKGPVDLP